MLRLLVLLAAALLSFSCGYIGEPMPPALHIPQRVTDLSAVEKGGKILVQFTLPAYTTDNLEIRKPLTVELHVGPTKAPFQLELWEAGAKVFTGLPVDQPAVQYVFPATEWSGKDVAIGVKVFGANGRTAGWSYMFILSVITPLQPPALREAEDVAAGVRLTWESSAPHYRIYRRAADEKDATAIGETDQIEYTDEKAAYGKPYYYSVEGFRTDRDIHAVSERSAEVTITTKDTYPPPVPAGLAAVASTHSIELMWDRSTAPDLAGYRVYRAAGGGAFQKLGETREAPSYSDRTVEPGKSYRYAVTAFDNLGNESAMSAPVDAAVP
jgi:hypothetical protein